jgi:phosphinothricin acetyltransferase
MTLMIELARPEDLPRIVEIYNATIPSFRVTADLEPVSVESRLEWFAMHRTTVDDPQGNPSRPLWVMRQDQSVIGWLSFSDIHDRAAYARTAELSLYVAEEWRGQGVGGRLLDKAIAEAPALGCARLLALIFGHNEESLALFESRGFQRWGFYPEVAELNGVERDLVVMGIKADANRNTNPNASTRALPGQARPW